MTGFSAEKKKKKKDVPLVMHAAASFSKLALVASTFRQAENHGSQNILSRIFAARYDSNWRPGEILDAVFLFPNLSHPPQR